jgi:putative transposase
MRKSKFTKPQILDIINEYAGGKSAEKIAIDHKITPATFHVWNRKYGKQKTGVAIKVKGEKDSAKRIKELEEENSMLKRMYGELSLQHGILKDSFN